MPSKTPGAVEQMAPGFFRRLAAIVYDSLLLLAVLFLATAVALPFNAGQAFSPDQYAFPLYLVLVSFVFFGWFWTHGGQTLGMRAWKIKLTRLDGGRVNWRQAGARFGMAIVSWGLLGLGVIWSLFDRQRLSWHDRASNTRLIRCANGKNPETPPGTAVKR